MKRRLLPLAFIAALLLAFGAVAVACGGGGGGSSADGREPLTLEEYFQRFEEARSEREQQSDDLEYNNVLDLVASPSESESVQAMRAFLLGTIDVYERYENELLDLAVPDNARDAHDEFVDGLDQVQKDTANFLEQLDGVETMAEFFAIADAEDVPPVYERLEEVCSGLQQVANEGGINVDLGC